MIPKFYNKRIKLVAPVLVILMCVAAEFHHYWLKPVNQDLLESAALDLVATSEFNPKVAVYNIFTEVNSGAVDGVYFHWDDFMDLLPGQSVFGKFRQGGICDAVTENFGNVRGYFMESYHRKVLRGMTRLFCSKDVPAKIFLRGPNDYIEVPVLGKKHQGDDFERNFSHQQLVLEFQKLDSSAFRKFPLHPLNRTVELDTLDFYFDPEFEIFRLNQLKHEHRLTAHEEKYLQFLTESDATVDHSDRFFQYPWIYTDVVQGNSHHLAYPFFKRYVGIRERQSVIQHMIRAWFEFAEAIQVPSWVNYGSLLGWAYNGVNMPWDTDVDIQLSIRHLDYLSQHYNNSLVFENPKLGNAKYLLEISPTYIRQGNSKNFIDGRFIDINSGLYIDISALSHTNYDPDHPEDFSDKDTLVHCKHFNWHSLTELLPIRHTYFEGSSIYIPSNISSILTRKYGRESFTTKSHFLHYNYQKDIQLWVSDDICERSPSGDRFAGDDQAELTFEGACKSAVLQDEYRINARFAQRHAMLNRDVDLPAYYDVRELGDLALTRKDPWQYYHDVAHGRTDLSWYHEYDL